MVFPGVKKIIKEFDLEQSADFGSGRVKNCFIRICDAQNCKLLDILPPVDELSQADREFLDQFKLKPYKAKVDASDEWVHIEFKEYFLPYSKKKIILLIREVTDYFSKTYPTASARKDVETSDSVLINGRQPMGLKSILLLAVAIAAPMIVKNTIKHANATDDGAAFFEKVAEEVRKECPMQVDEYTELTNCSFQDFNNNNKDDEGDEFAYYYTMKGLEFTDEEQESFREDMRGQLLQNVKTDNFEEMRSRKVNISFNYNDSEGNLQFRFLFTPADYNSPE